jgi:High potential iron-sulfur protein
MGDGCEKAGVSRRTVLFAAAGAVPALALMTTAAEAKMAQAAVHYQADPKDGKQCDGCNFFVAPNVCKMVDGDIAATGWCALWVKKAGA